MKKVEYPIERDEIEILKERYELMYGADYMTFKKVEGKKCEWSDDIDYYLISYEAPIDLIRLGREIEMIHQRLFRAKCIKHMNEQNM